MLSPSSYTFACTNWITYTLYTYRIRFMVCRSACPYSLPSYMMLSLACVHVRVFSHSSLVMSGDHGEDRCCGLSMGWNGGDGWIPLGDVDCHALIC
jgi:hypothetical protein